MIKKLALLPLVALVLTPALAQETQIWPPNGNDIPAKFTPPVDPNADYIKREVEVPMRDGVKLHTVIVIPKGATNAPIVLTRTPYHADARAKRSDSVDDDRHAAAGRRSVRHATATSASIRTFAASTGRRAAMSRRARWSARSTRPRSITPPTRGTRSTGW